MRVRRFWLGRIATEIGVAIAASLLASAGALALGQTQGASQTLQLTVSAESQEIVEPLPIRLVLHFHNSGTQLLWLYKPVRDAAAMSQSPLGPSPGGSTLAAHLEPQSASAGVASVTPAVGTLLRAAGMPRPRLISVPPGGSYQEPLAIHIAPAEHEAGASHSPLWGAYQLSVAYSASYANGADINRSLGVDVWQGSVSSNSVSIQIQPASAADAGSISGTVLNRQMEQDWGILVSLSDSSQQLVAQMLTGNDGGFSFSHLPYGRYWVTVRTPGSNFNSGFFEHADLSPSDPAATLRLIMLNPEDSDDARELLHKPVLFRIRDNAGNPLAGAELSILWSNGPIMETLKAETSEDGLAEINLIPGSNYVTIRKRGCPKQDEMANVATGPGIDGFVMTFSCQKQ
jgi:Carboxypeptidase regulatory-like domain